MQKYFTQKVKQIYIKKTNNMIDYIYYTIRQKTTNKIKFLERDARVLF
jgi:hypothetical protein